MAQIIKYTIFALGMLLKTISALRDMPGYSGISENSACSPFSVINLCLANAKRFPQWRSGQAVGCGLRVGAVASRA